MRIVEISKQPLDHEDQEYYHYHIIIEIKGNKAYNEIKKYHIGDCELIQKKEEETK